MPSSRLIKLLLLVAVALIGIVAATLILKRPVKSKTPFEQATDQAEKIAVQVGTTTITLSKSASGWNVSAPSVGPYRAAAGQVQALEANLKKVSIEDVISETGSHAGDYQVNPESATQISLYDKAQTLLAAGTFGKQADDVAHFYFRYPNQPAIYLARGGIQAGTNINAWREHAFLNAPEDQVLTLLIEGPGYRTTLLRTTDTWSLDGQIIDPAPVWKMLGILAHVRTEEFVDLGQHPELASDKLAVATITVQLKDGSNQILHIGAKDRKGKRYPVSANSDLSVGWVPESTVEPLLRKPASFSVKKPGK